MELTWRIVLIRGSIIGITLGIVLVLILAWMIWQEPIDPLLEEPKEYVGFR